MNNDNTILRWSKFNENQPPTKVKSLMKWSRPFSSSPTYNSILFWKKQKFYCFSIEWNMIYKLWWIDCQICICIRHFRGFSRLLMDVAIWIMQRHWLVMPNKKIKLAWSVHPKHYWFIRHLDQDTYTLKVFWTLDPYFLFFWTFLKPHSSTPWAARYCTTAFFQKNYTILKISSPLSRQWIFFMWISFMAISLDLIEIKPA